MDLLKTRVRLAKHPDLREAGLYIVCKRKECAKLNQEYLNSIKGELMIMKATHHHAKQKTYKPWIEPKEGAVSTTSFLDELKLKLVAKVMLIHNIDTVDCLTNRQLGELIDVINTKKGEVDKLKNSKISQTVLQECITFTNDFQILGRVKSFLGWSPSFSTPNFLSWPSKRVQLL